MTEKLDVGKLTKIPGNKSKSDNLELITPSVTINVEAGKNQ